MPSIATRLNEINRHVPVGSLIAVSKGQPVSALTEALTSGQLAFGENRVQEAQEKWPELKKNHPDAKLHLIGPLQTNKVKDALAIFDVIHTVDREKLVDALAAQQCRIPCFIQVNIGKEPQKHGVLPEDAPAFVAYAREAGLNVVGLMCIPPAEEDPRPYFALLRELAKANGLPQLSMGMSGDYRVALEEGATLVRIGTAIFGERA